MRIGYGWPTVLNSTVVSDKQQQDVGDIISIEQLTDHFVVVFERAAQLWAGGQARNFWHRPFQTKMACDRLALSALMYKRFSRSRHPVHTRQAFSTALQA